MKFGGGGVCWGDTYRFGVFGVLDGVFFNRFVDRGGVDGLCFSVVFGSDSFSADDILLTRGRGRETTDPKSNDRDGVLVWVSPA